MYIVIINIYLLSQDECGNSDVQTQKPQKRQVSQVGRKSLVSQCTGLFHLRLEVDRMAQGQNSVLVLLYFLSIIIPPLLLVYAFITPRCTADPLEAAVLPRHNLTPSRQQ